jgi:hypothetical protein
VEQLSRRSFLLASAGVVALAAGACKSGKDDEIKVSPSDTASLPGGLSLVVSSYVHVTGIDERVTVALLKGDGPYTASGPVAVSIDGKPVEAVLHKDGIALPYYLIRHRFDTAGIHDIDAVVQGKKLTTPVEVADAASTKVPVPGKPLVRVATPTVADGRGVNPICTQQPACPLHDVSLDAALDEKRPLAVLFATPALCQSRLCGPVLGNLLAARDEFGAKVRMLHVEIYTDLSGKTTAPAVDAYGLESEPFLFLAGADGVVRERLDNAYDKLEVRDALTRLVA